MDNIVTPSPMDDTDLAFNFKAFRRRYYTRHGLEMPADVTLSFHPIEEWRVGKEGAGLPEACLRDEEGHFTIHLQPYLAVVYSSAKIAILHEMAHIRAKVITGNRRTHHGPLFQAEIDRLYRLGAYRKLL